MEDTILTVGTPSGDVTLNFGDLSDVNIPSSYPPNSPQANAAQMQLMESSVYTNSVFVDLLKLSNNKNSVLNSINHFASAEWYRTNYIYNSGKPDFGLTYYDIVSGRLNIGHEKDPVKYLSSGAMAPFAALKHYMDGTGDTLTFKLGLTGLDKISPSALTPVLNLVDSYGSGAYLVGDNKFIVNTADYNVVTGAILGRITLTTEGELQINSNGSWNYQGVIRAFNDTYDANSDPSRGVLGEASTVILSWFNGKPYQIEIPGELPVSASGQK